jgi:hypothetical protein
MRTLRNYYLVSGQEETSARASMQEEPRVCKSHLCPENFQESSLVIRNSGFISKLLNTGRSRSVL